MFKKIAIALVAAVTLSAFSTALAASYLANPRSMKFHYSSCRTIKRPQNYIEYEDREEAVMAGYVPCKVCRP